MNFRKLILLFISIGVVVSCDGGNAPPESAEALLSGGSGSVAEQSVDTPEDSGNNESDSSAEALLSGGSGSVAEQSVDTLEDSGNNESDSSAEEQQTPLTVSVDRVAAWKGDARAAYSIIHDDYPYITEHFSELGDRELRAGFGVIVEPCEQSDDCYDMMRQLVGQGHEIINHSYSHADLTAADADWDQEVDHSTGVLRGRGFDINAFVFPYDHYNDAILQRLQTLGYLGARGGLRGRNRVNPADLDIDDPLAPFRINYDSYFEDPATGKNTHSEYRDQGDVLKAYVDDAIQQGGWAVRELHGIEDGSWGVVSISRYRAHLDDVVAKIQSNELWMDTFSNVNRYRSSRAYCGAALVQDGAITFSMYTSADCEKYATLLSVIVNATGADAIKVSQNGLDIPVQSLGVNKYLMEIDPTEGPAFVTRFESAE